MKFGLEEFSRRDLGEKSKGCDKKWLSERLSKMSTNTQLYNKSND